VTFKSEAIAPRRKASPPGSGRAYMQKDLGHKAARQRGQEPRRPRRAEGSERKYPSSAAKPPQEARDGSYGSPEGP
jgi:hypothetical protein